MPTIRWGPRVAIALALISLVAAGTGYALVSGQSDIANLGAGALVVALGAAMQFVFPGGND